MVDARATSWREHAVERSLDPARMRAERRVQRFLDAAVELMNNSTDREFTVQAVVERSGQSLRSFYQHFTGKHELLLALFEEAVRSAATRLQEEIDLEAEGVERLRLAVTAYYSICRPVGRTDLAKAEVSPAMVEFAQHLLTAQPAEASRAFAPLVVLFEGYLDDAAAAGAIRSDLHHRRLAGVILQAVMFNAFTATIAGSPTRSTDGDSGDELWDFILRGIAAGSAA